MCFSAEASFLASAALGVTGIMALNKAKEPSQAVFAGIPIIFAVQQCAEGLLWLSFTQTSFFAYRPLFTYVFLFFALVVWPIWIPYSTWLTEKEISRKTVFLYLLLSGFIVAGIMAYGMLFYQVVAENSQHHIHYSFEFNQVLVGPRSIIYFIPALVPPLLASNSRVRVLGLSLLITYAIAKLTYPTYVISVWCYFAALISVVVLWILNAPAKTSNLAFK